MCSDKLGHQGLCCFELLRSQYRLRHGRRHARDQIVLRIEVSSLSHTLINSPTHPVKQMTSFLLTSFLLMDKAYSEDNLFAGGLLGSLAFLS